MRIYADTDIGMVRQINQDAYYISEENDNYKLCILADGMGGYTGGEIASRLACIGVAEYIKKNFEDKKQYTKEEYEEIKEFNGSGCFRVDATGRFCAKFHRTKFFGSTF